MFFTLEIQHVVRSGKEMDFLAQLKELKANNGQFRDSLLSNMILNYFQETDNSIQDVTLPDLPGWHYYLESPSRVKIRMSS